MYNHLISLLLFNLLTSDVFGARLTVQHGNKVKSVSEFPFIVLLAGPKTICSGSLITQSSVLSAGHCACGKDPLTDVFTDTLSMTSLGSRRMVSKKIVHPDYARSCRFLLAGITNVGEVNDHDSAIFKLLRPFTHKSQASLANLDFTSQMPVGSRVMVAGYGLDESVIVGPNSGVLKYGRMTTVRCIIRGTYGNICVRGTSYQNAAPGDSGGPLMKLNKQVVGTVSGIMKYYNGYSEIVYVRIKPHKEFILSNA